MSFFLRTFAPVAFEAFNSQADASIKGAWHVAGSESGFRAIDQMGHDGHDRPSPPWLRERLIQVGRGILVP